MNVLMINGSPRINGNTTIALEEMRKAFDEEGKQTMHVLARNMAFLMKSIALGKEQFGLPKTEEHAWTHFIR
jgi:multimeric flavodoxin wrbA